MVAVFSLTERASLAEAGAAVARLQARVPALPAILVGNKTDLVRTRRVSAEGDQPRPAPPSSCSSSSSPLYFSEARAVAGTCDCKYVEVQCRSAGRGSL